MNILKPITTLFRSGTVLRDMLIDAQSQDILTYLTPNTVMFVDITNKLRKKSEEGVDTEVFGPFQTTFGNPANLPCDLTLAREFFKTYYVPHGVKDSPHMHILTDTPISLYAWKLSQQHHNIGALQDELYRRPTAIIQRAPMNRRWVVMNPYLKVYTRESKSEFAVICGVQNDNVASITEWCSEARAYTMSVYPISLIGLQKALALQNEPLQAYIFWGNNAKFCVISHKEKGVIFAEDTEVTTLLNDEYINGVFAHLDEIATDINVCMPTHSAYLLKTEVGDNTNDSRLIPLFAKSAGLDLGDIANLYTSNYYK